MKLLNRRAVLRGSLFTGAALALPLPLLNSMLNGNGTALAQGDPLPRRYCTWFFGNGILPPLWNPASTAADWQLSEQLAPLANVKDWLNVVSGLRNEHGNSSPHPIGSAAATTGGSVANNSAVAPSIDQIVAEVNSGGSFRSLEIGVTDATPNGPENTLHTCSHRGPNAPNYPEFDPHAAFTRIFTGATDDASVEAVRAWNQAKRSILDATLADGAELSARLGSADRQRLEDHLEAVRDIELRLESAGQSNVELPADPESLGVGKDVNSEAPSAVNAVMADMLAAALATDRTRNATFIFTLPAAHVYYRSLGTDMNDDFHDTICHGDAGDASEQTRVHRGVIYAMEALAVFVEKLASLTEGSETLLDRSLVYATSCTAWGKPHGIDDWPALLIGRAGGAVQTNQHINTAGGNLSDVLFTIAKTFDSPIASLGAGPGESSSEIPGIRIT
jgi:Protein of unknown function (DUF1552)